MFAQIRKLLGANPREVLHLAIARAAQLAGEREEAQVRVSTYMGLVDATDPSEDWWGYADVRQRLQDARDDYLELNKRVVAAQAQVDALLALPE